MNRIHARVEVLTEEEIERIHRATLEVLSTVGCRLPHRKVLDRLEREGAEVDRASARVRMGAELVERALGALSGGRRTSGDERFQGGVLRDGRLRLGLSTQANIVDYETSSRRRGTTDDVLRGIAVTNELPHVGYAMPVVVPSDVPAYMADLYGYYLCALYSRKPFGVYIMSPESGRQIVRLARARYRGEDVRIWYLLEPNGALSYDDFSLELAISFAESGQGFCLGPMAMAGLDAPVTLAGTLVMQNAHNLIGNVLAYLWGQPGGWSGSAHTADMRTGTCLFGSPNQMLIGVAAVQIGGWYGFGSGANCALTDACTPDFQAGFEKGASALMMLLAGGGFGAQGIVGADQGVSLEQLVIDDEWAGYLEHALSHGIEVNDETLGLEAIRRAGIGGSFIDDEHTARHMRTTQWHSTIFNWDVFEAWKAKGALDTRSRARARLEEILARCYPPELLVSAEAKAEMDAIVEEARAHPERFEVRRYA